MKGKKKINPNLIKWTDYTLKEKSIHRSIEPLQNSKDSNH